jgi:acyl-CoA synthetase (AMP-forming)/AMP-acid ligase II
VCRWAWSDDRVAVLLPNGPEASLCLLACVAYHVCAPLNCNLSPDELRSELTSLACVAVIVPHPSSSLALPAKTFDFLTRFFPEGRMLFLSRDATDAGMFTLSANFETTGAWEWAVRAPGRLNGPGDTALVLHTSGTSGRKKIVPYPLENIVVGAACILASWDLTPQDVNFNMMPLFHIGGIARNLFAPLFAGMDERVPQSHCLARLHPLSR